MNHNDLVHRLYDEQPAEKTIPGALAFTLRVLGAIPADEQAGLLYKPTGENIIEYHGVMVAAARVCFPDGVIYKVLTDVPDGNGPAWEDNGTVDPSRWVPLVPVADVVPDAVLDVVPSPVVDDIDFKLDALAALSNHNTERVLAEIQRARTDTENSLKQYLPALETLARFFQ